MSIHTLRYYKFFIQRIKMFAELIYSLASLLSRNKYFHPTDGF